MSSQANIRNTFLDQKSPQHPEVGVLQGPPQTDRQADRQTDGHGDSMTNSAQWGRVGENLRETQQNLINLKR